MKVDYLRNGVIGLFSNKGFKVLLLRVFGVGFFFALSLFITNNFEANLVGKYDFVRSFLLIIGGLTMLGTNQGIIYYSGVLKASNSLGSLKNTYTKMVVIIACVALFCFALSFFLNENWVNKFFDKPEAASLISKLVLTLFFFALTMLNIDTMRGLNRTLLSELFRNIFRYSPFLLFTVVLYITAQPELLIEAYLFGFVVLSMISTIVVFVMFNRYTVSEGIKKYNYVSILKRSYPMALSAVAYFLMQSVDIILLSKFESFETVAYYSIAVKLVTVCSMALFAVSAVLAPKIAEIYERKQFKKLSKLIKTNTRLMVGLSIPLFLILGFFPSFFLGLFGNDYVLAKTALLWLLLGHVFNVFCGPVAVYMNMTGRQSILQRILFVGLLVNFGLNWILIPKYGMEGASWATAISTIAWNLLAVSYTYTKDRTKTFLS